MKNVKRYCLIPESLELDYVIIDEYCTKQDVFRALEDSPLHFAAYPAPADLCHGKEDCYFVVVNTHASDQKIKKLPQFTGCMWMSPDRTRALYEGRTNIEKMFEAIAIVEKATRKSI